ncbi:unnamed protein product [marine sediment metagenome]|uniref:Uncharacterized protein n=1 Tax=marine sediment metagenome TaxID=412755 RepID=X0U858_9ZZZZ
MRVCIEKATGRIIESQSGGETHPDPKVKDDEYAAKNLDTLLQNAINAGYAEDEIEVFYENDADFEVRMAAQVESERTYIDRRRVAYPDPMELNDGLVKQHSSDPDIQAEGDAQVAKYYEDCLKVKEDIPKS